MEHVSFRHTIVPFYAVARTFVKCAGVKIKFNSKKKKNFNLILNQMPFINFVNVDFNAVHVKSFPIYQAYYSQV